LQGNPQRLVNPVRPHRTAVANIRCFSSTQFSGAAQTFDFLRFAVDNG
jgi:hypothetical protein